MGVVRCTTRGYVGVLICVVVGWLVGLFVGWLVGISQWIGTFCVLLVNFFVWFICLVLCLVLCL